MTTTANFENKIKELSAKVHRRGINYSLDKLKASADQLGNPEEALPPVVHLAGTNGKGSTLSFLKQILVDSGYSVACFSSPHWESYRERLVISNKSAATMISEQDFVDYITRVQTQCSLYEELHRRKTGALQSINGTQRVGNDRLVSNANAAIGRPASRISHAAHTTASTIPQTKRADVQPSSATPRKDSNRTHGTAPASEVLWPTTMTAIKLRAMPSTKMNSPIPR